VFFSEIKNADFKMGIGMSKSSANERLNPPFSSGSPVQPDSNRFSWRSCLSCCFPWLKARSVPYFDYDDTDDELEFEALLPRANSLDLQKSTSNESNSRRRNNQVWETIAGLFSGFKRHPKHIDDRLNSASPLSGYVRGYQSLDEGSSSAAGATADLEDEFLFGNTSNTQEVEVLSQEQLKVLASKAKHASSGDSSSSRQLE
jgi:hypothetical protein